MSLIALALQCLYDEKELDSHEEEPRSLATKHEGSWIAYLATDTLANHEKKQGRRPLVPALRIQRGAQGVGGAQGAGGGCSDSASGGALKVAFR